MASTFSTIERLDERITQVRVPLPFPLRYINAYLLRGSQGYTVIDPGLNTPDSMLAWDEALHAAGIRFSDIKQIVLTHHHPDHVGLAGTFQERSGAPVLLSEQGIAQVAYLWREEREATTEIHAQFTRHGMDSITGERMLEHLEEFVSLVSPLPTFTPLPANSTLTMGDRDYRTILTSGHAYGQLMLLDEASGDLFCGDHVLPRISPNISLLPRFDANPLQSFLDSLAAIADLPVRRVFPGHRESFTDFAERCKSLIRHHHDRLAQMLGRLDEPTTGYALCVSFFGQSLSIHQLRFAFAETLAHLVYLREQGKVAELPPDETNTAIRYKRI